MPRHRANRRIMNLHSQTPCRDVCAARIRAVVPARLLGPITYVREISFRLFSLFVIIFPTKKNASRINKFERDACIHIARSHHYQEHQVDQVHTQV